MLLTSAVLLIAVTVAFTLFVRAKDMPAVEQSSPIKHLEDRRAAIYENLRDLQFEYRLGKLSDVDYQQTKVGLQKELAGVLAEMERLTGGAPPAKAAVRKSPEPKESLAEQAAETEIVPTESQPADAVVCPHCGAEFASPMKFCGECGKAMS